MNADETWASVPAGIKAIGNTIVVVCIGIGLAGVGGVLFGAFAFWYGLGIMCGGGLLHYYNAKDKIYNRN